MGHTGLHLMSVDYRKRGDMTIWAEGRLGLGVTPTIKVEFAQLFDATAPTADGAPAARDGAVRSDGPQGADHGTTAPDGGAKPPGQSDGCGCAVGAPPATPIALVLGVALMLLVARRRR
jgi:MYXO-CTERM domain-containing protein